MTSFGYHGVAGVVTSCIHGREMDLCWETCVRASKLLQVRELYGNVIPFKKRKRNFKEEFRKIQVSQPVVWKYSETDKIADGALEKIHVDVQTPEGLTETDALLTGGANGSLSFVEVGKVRPHFDYEVKCMPDRAWPFIKENQAEYGTIPGPIRRSARGSLRMGSDVSCIKLFGKQSTTIENDSSIRDALVSNLGSETSRGSLSIVKLIEPLDLDWSFPATRRRMRDVASFNCTIWTADCNFNWSRAVIGTNLGAALVDLETGDASWVCRSKSDVFALQFIHSGNALLCGLRDGAIVTVDVREKREGSSAALISHIPYSSSDKTLGSSSRQVFEVKLYDHRLIQRGAVQSYEGHVNSRTRIQLAVDPSDKFVMSGGEDCKLRIWSIKTGELLFEDKFSNSVPSTVCWHRAERLLGVQDETQWYKECIHQQGYGLKAWLGSHKGLFYMDWSGIYSDALM